MADSVWNTQIQGFWVGLTGRSSLEVAFANYRFWMSFGMSLGFFITRFATVNAYLVCSFILLLIGVMCYFATEMIDPMMTQLKKVRVKEAEKLELPDNSIAERDRSFEKKKSVLEKV